MKYGRDLVPPLYIIGGVEPKRGTQEVWGTEIAGLDWDEEEATGEKDEEVIEEEISQMAEIIPR